MHATYGHRPCFQALPFFSFVFSVSFIGGTKPWITKEKRTDTPTPPPLPPPTAANTANLPVEIIASHEKLKRNEKEGSTVVWRKRRRSSRRRRRRRRRSKKGDEEKVKEDVFT